MKQPYAKPHVPVAQQIILLKERGLEITNDNAAERALTRIGYYRLSGYWYPMRRMGPPDEGRSSDFEDGAKLSDAVEMYVFDKRLRMLLLDAIERIEVAVRVELALRLGARDPWLHRDAAALNEWFTTKNGETSLHDNWIARVDGAAMNSKEDFAKHFYSKYDSPLPIWMSIELWDFGVLSYLVSGLQLGDRDGVANRLGLPRATLLTSWIRALNDARNICAHHGRLWNRAFSTTPAPPRLGEIPHLDHLRFPKQRRTRLYAIAASLRHLLLFINADSDWHNRLKALMAAFPATEHLRLEATGFEPEWEKLDLWQ